MYSRQFQFNRSSPHRLLVLSLTVRTDWVNAFNRCQLSAPVTDLTSPSFGRITSQRAARVIQLGVRYSF